MPVIYRIDKATRTLHTTSFGWVTLADVIAYFHKLEHDPDCPGYLDILLDLSQEKSTHSPEYMRDVAAEVGRLQYKLQFGFCAVATGRNAMFGMIRMFQVFAEKYFREIQVFRTVVEAEVWLASKRKEDPEPSTLVAH